MNAILSTLLSPIVKMWHEHEEREATRSAWAAKLDAEWTERRKVQALAHTLEAEARGDRFNWCRVDDLTEDAAEIRRDAIRMKDSTIRTVRAASSMLLRAYLAVRRRIVG